MIAEMAKAADLTVSRAINTLAYALKSSDETVVVAGRKIQIYELGAQQDICHMLARNLKIVFIGGPPGAHERYEGTLLTMLMDRIIWEEIHGSTMTTKILETLLGHRLQTDAIVDWMTTV
jgi:hypothetical protein